MSREASIAGRLSEGSPLRHLTRSEGWLRNTAWALVDQALFGLTNFLLNVMMARWLSQESYGAFTLAFSVFLLLLTVHTGLLAEPMLVFGAGKYRSALAAYLRVLMRGHWILTVLASLILLFAAIVFGYAGEPSLSLPLISLALANPFILWLWLMRRSCYVGAGPRIAANGNIWYTVILLVSACALVWLERLSTSSAFAVMGAASVASGLYIRSRVKFTGSPHVPRAFQQDVVLTHCVYGRWAVGTGLLGAVTLYLYYLALPVTHGLGSAATLRALTNIVLPAAQFYWVISVVNVPRLVRARGTPGFPDLVRQMFIMHLGAALLFWLSLGAFHAYVVGVLYGGQYNEASHLLWLMGLVPVAIAAESTLETVLRSAERADAVFRANAFAAICTCVVGLPLMSIRGIEGAIWGILASYACALVSLVTSVRAQRQHFANAAVAYDVNANECTTATR